MRHCDNTSSAVIPAQAGNQYSEASRSNMSVTKYWTLRLRGG